LNTEILELDGRFGEEYQGKYVFAEITWAKRSRIIQKHTKYHPVSGEVISSDFIAIQAETIMASIHGQPDSHPVTLEKLLSDENGVPIGLGEFFSQVANRLNSVNSAEACFLSELSDAKNPTKQSLTSDSAKNSVGPQPSLPSNQPKPSSSSPSSLES
jgi:hypothetical protein